MPSLSDSSPSPIRVIADHELNSAIALLHDLIPQDQLQVYSLRHSPATVYTTLATLWMLTLQRLGGGTSLENIVKETLENHPEIFPDNKRVREGMLSQNASAFSAARQRLTLEQTESFVDGVSHSITHSYPHLEDLDLNNCLTQTQNTKTFIIDGTTFKLAPTSELCEVYPPATNQHGESVWPILMLTVAHEMRSGVALRPEFGAMYGDKNTSEAKQAMAMAKRIPTGSVVLADAGYGIFSVVHAMVQAGQKILFRLTKSRFKSMHRKAELINQTKTSRHFRLHWKPSAKDRQANPNLPADAELFVDLHEIEIDNGELLYLVTNMSLDSKQAGEWYAHRYDVEHDIRDIKVTLGVENIRAKSDAMVRKEVLCSMVAYNLVVQLRRVAAAKLKVPPRRLSFTGVWNTLEVCLLRTAAGDVRSWKERYAAAVNMAMKDKLPNRPGRNYPRQAHPKRPKSTKFMKQKSKEKHPPTKDNPSPDP